MSDPLVTPAWLAERLDDPAVVILDSTWFMPGSGRDAREEYARAHIPGAAFFDIDEIADHASGLPHMLAAPADFAVAVRRLGVSSTSTVVAYDAAGLFSAPRVWWTFRAMGHEAVRVLDGGLPKWLAEGHGVETGWRARTHGDFKGRLVPSLVRNVEQMGAILDNRGEQVIDARPADRFAGATPEPRPELRSGHMPGARNLPFSGLVLGDGTLAPPADLRAAFGAAGVDLAAPIVTTCGSGISAAVLALALARLGRDDVALYDGSWAEWGGRTDTPVVTGSAPPLTQAVT